MLAYSTVAGINTNLIMTESDNGAAPRQLTLFAVESIEEAAAPPLPPNYDSYWDEITNGDRTAAVPEQQIGDIVLEQDTREVLPIVEYLEKIGGARQLFVLERDTKNPVPEQKTPGFGDYTDVPEHIKTVPEHLHWVEKYCPSKRKDNHYYRYCWKTGRKIKHRHIAGGNVRSQLAQHRKGEVEIAIADGQPPSEIEKLIHSWRS
ncbi:MAG: hypothetical protein RMZ42_22485 [Nostoc sp. DedQUE05]|uniref:hypothetical protein n=1 Tax=Nostoc sp. DedQUE05 TaxID=3075391 RepID=UPI002AD3E4D5|nr:hypothetical protein [Nostoc sp. DedQUE05]MDZ8094677.1 hypothetical protein [Nostoc sp. DedQUE05]